MDDDRLQRPALNPNAPVFVPRFSAPPSQPPPQQPPPQALQKTSPVVENPAQKETAPVVPMLSVEPKSQKSATAAAPHSCATIPADSSVVDKILRPPSPSAENSVPVTNCTPSTNAKVDDKQKAAESTWEDMEEENDAERTNEAAASTEAKRTMAPAAPKPKKEHVNVIFIGHVDAGKSTIGGQLMYLTGQVDKRTLEKYEKEAREMNRESWYLSWALDTNAEEREKGKTVQVGRANFETDRKHFTILDAPGHKSFVPNMIGGASQADLAVLVISARKGEFEAGLERGGQTREHAMLVKTAGVRHLIVLINKMDDVTVNWDKSRYDDTKEKLLPVLKKIGFLENKDLYFMPCSGYTGAFLKDPPDEKTCSWYRGPTFIDYLDNLPPLSRAREGPVRIVLSEKYNDMGTVVMGKVESGVVTRSQTLLLMPNKTSVQAIQLWSDDDDADEIGPGENVKIKLKGVEEEGVMPGFVLCSPDNYCKVGKIFDAQVMILEHKSIICPGYSAVLHIHAAIEEVSIKALLCLIDRKTLEKTKLHPRFVKQDQVCIMRLESNEVFCLEPFKDFPQMGRFVLRDEGRTIAIGKVLKVIE